MSQNPTVGSVTFNTTSPMSLTMSGTVPEEAIEELRAIMEEANRRVQVQALRDVECLSSLQTASTRLLVEELRKREGVEAIDIEPYAEYSVTGSGREVKETGPAILLVVTD